MNKELSREFYELAETSYERCKKDMTNDTVDHTTAIIIQHAAECYFKAMLEIATKESTIYQLYRTKDAKKLSEKKGKTIRPEEISLPDVPHRLKYLFEDLLTEDKNNKNIFYKLTQNNTSLKRESDNIYHTYTFYRFPRDPEHTTCSIRHYSDIYEGFQTLQDIQSICRNFLRQYEVLASYDMSEEIDLDDPEYGKK